MSAQAGPCRRLFGWLTMLNWHRAIGETAHSDWLFSVVNQCTRVIAKVMKVSKWQNQQCAHRRLFYYYLFTSCYLSNPKHKYFHNDMGVWSEENEDQLINMIYYQNGKQALLGIPTVQVSFLFYRELFPLLYTVISSHSGTENTCMLAIVSSLCTVFKCNFWPRCRWREATIQSDFVTACSFLDCLHA